VTTPTKPGDVDLMLTALEVALTSLPRGERAERLADALLDLHVRLEQYRAEAVGMSEKPLTELERAAGQLCYRLYLIAHRDGCEPMTEAVTLANVLGVREWLEYKFPPRREQNRRFLVEALGIEYAEALERQATEYADFVALLTGGQE
jgi:hypothetical protein